jgi:hypothetical protein
MGTDSNARPAAAWYFSSLLGMDFLPRRGKNPYSKSWKLLASQSPEIIREK